MIRFISFDMDGTLIAPEFTDWVWNYGIPRLYAEKKGLPFDSAKAYVEGEYRKVGEKALEWYDIKYWFQFLGLNEGWTTLMERFSEKISVYSDVKNVLERLRGRFPMVLTSNAGREFIELEMETTGLMDYFERTFSATSDFRSVKKTPDFYRHLCRILGASPWEVVHVGDHYEFDYLVPRAIGIQAFYLDRCSQRQGDFVIRDLSDLEKWLPETGWRK
jgi:HAD superfamily hydrolase (TIGR01549 family)